MGRVMDTTYVKGWLWGWVQTTTVNLSTFPSTPMFPVTNTVTYLNGQGWPATYTYYVDHEHLYIPAIGVTEWGQTCSSMFYPWDSSTLVP